VAPPPEDSDEALARRLQEEEVAGMGGQHDEELALALAREFEAAAGLPPGALIGIAGLGDLMTENGLSFAVEPVDERPAAPTEAELQRLPTHRAGPRQCQEECPVCFLPYEEGEELRTLPCLHAFHTECIDRWLTSRRESALCCPICHTKVEF